MLLNRDIYVRPLLSVTKRQLVEYLHVNNYTWYEDESNLSRKYKRNKVRLDVIPLLSEICGNEQALYRYM